MATPGRIKRRFYLHTAMEWVLLRDKDGNTRKIRIVPRQSKVTWRERETEPARHFVRTKEQTDDGLPLYREIQMGEIVGAA